MKTEPPNTPLWNQSRIQKLIDDKIQESLILDYKAADSLSQTEKHKKEITKDVSALANSAGGMIIYGVAEYNEADKKHLPEKIDPVDQTQFSREWLDQVINNIKPRIQGVLIHPVPISSVANHVAYVVEIPQSTTAHQATDLHYYKRYNFVSVPMVDYEIRDIMGRRQHPKIVLGFRIEAQGVEESDGIGGLMWTTINDTLIVEAANIGDVYVQYVTAVIKVPIELFDFDDPDDFNTDDTKLVVEDGQQYCEHREENTVRDFRGYELSGEDYVRKYDPIRYRPILPKLTTEWEIRLGNHVENRSGEGLQIKWTAYADNAPAEQGVIEVKNIRIVQQR